MGLFGGKDDDEDETQEVNAPPAEGEDGQDPDQPTDENANPEAVDEATQDEEEEEEDGLKVEEALKDLSARMAVLSSNLEGVQDSRSELEDQLGNVEERMSRLGSLAEAVSSEYNPFITENAPDQPSWTPELEDKEDLDDLPASESSSGEPEPPTLDETAHDQPPNPEGNDQHEAQPSPEPAQPLQEEPSLEMPRTDPERLETALAEPIEDVQPEPAQNPFPTTQNTELEENLLLLEWVGMMLDRVGRAGLMDLLDYYQNLGWLDRTTKDRATRVAVGVDAPDRVGDAQWRGDVDLHRRSLVAIQRLKGNEVPAARIDQLQLDLGRLFEE